MRRGRTVVRRRDLEGSERSLELGAVLGGMCSPELMEALVHGVAQLDSIGGQLFIAAHRPKYKKQLVENPQTGEILGEQWVELEDFKEPGDYETVAYAIHWDHIATAFRGARKEPDTPFPMDIERETVRLPTEEELWDQQEAEVDEMTEVDEERVAVGVTGDAFADEGADPAEADRNKES